MPPKKKKNGVKGKSGKANISDEDQILLEKRKKLIDEATRLQESIEEENAISRDFCTQTDKLRSFKEIQERDLEVSRWVSGLQKLEIHNFASIASYISIQIKFHLAGEA